MRLPHPQDVQFHWSVIGPALIWKRARKSGSVPNVFSPKTFNEKVLHRVLFDRREFIPRFSGKLESREYVLEKTGDPSLLTDLVGTACNLAELRQLPLPQKFIAKANHMSGRNWIHDGTQPLRLEALGNAISEWSGDLGMLQWGYSKVQRLALIEHLLESDSGPPKDYKFFCYNGRVHFIKVDSSRFSGHKSDFFDSEWNHLDVTLSYPNAATPPEQPQQLLRMKQLAEQLSSGIDFVRVDLYEIGDQIKFGELTCYPASGLGIFMPECWDDIFGRPWIVPDTRSTTR